MRLKLNLNSNLSMRRGQCLKVKESFSLNSMRIQLLITTLFPDFVKKPRNDFSYLNVSIINDWIKGGRYPSQSGASSEAVQHPTRCKAGGS